MFFFFFYFMKVILKFYKTFFKVQSIFKNTLQINKLREMGFILRKIVTIDNSIKYTYMTL